MLGSHEYHKNPAILSTAMLFAVPVAGAVGSYYAVRALLKPSAPTPAPSPAPAPPPVAPEEPVEGLMSGVFLPGATIAWSEVITTAMRLPYAFTIYPVTEKINKSPTREDFRYVTQVAKLAMRSHFSAADNVPPSWDEVPLLWLAARDPDTGAVGFRVDTEQMGVTDLAEMQKLLKGITVADGTPAGAIRQVGQLVTNLFPQAAEYAWEGALAQATKNIDLSGPGSTLDQCTRFAIKVIEGELPTTRIGEFDWAGAPGNLEAGTPEEKVWQGVQLICQLAYQTFRTMKQN